MFNDGKMSGAVVIVNKITKNKINEYCFINWKENTILTV